MPDSRGGITSPVEDPTWARPEDRRYWYDSKSMAAQRAYKRVKVVQLLPAAAVPVAAVLALPKLSVAALGALIVFEGIRQLNQWQTYWVLYRSTAEALRHERFLYLAHSGPHIRSNRHRVLAERIEGLVSQEHAKWTLAREQPSGDGSSAARGRRQDRN